MFKKTLSFLLLPLLAAGCAAEFTNLSPTRQVRKPENLYPVEVAFNSRQQTLLWNTIKPQVFVDGQPYQMRSVLMMTNRWEGLIPVPMGTSVVHYHYRFDFDSAGFGRLGRDSAVSPEFTLKVLDQQ